MSVRGQGFDHERLEVYQRSLDLVEAVDRFAARFTGNRKHLGWQLHRAATSVPLNIAEGNGRRQGNDRARFLFIATGSALECAAVLDLAEKLGVGSTAEHDEIRHLLTSIVPMLIKLSQTVRTRP